MKRFLVPALFVALLLGGVGGSLLMTPAGAEVSSPYSIGPRPTTFANLGTPNNGQHRWCSDCQATSPCTSGGSGAVATRVGGAWNCSAGGGGTSLSDSASLRSALSDETGTGAAVFATSPTIPSITGPTAFTGQYNSALADAGNSGAAKTVNWNSSNVQLVTLTDDCTFTFTNPQSGGRYVLLVKQDGTGSRTATWPAAVLWSGGAAPTLTTTAGKVDVITFVYDNVSSKYYGGSALNF